MSRRRGFLGICPSEGQMRRKPPCGATKGGPTRTRRRPSRNQNGSFFEEDRMTASLGRKSVLFLVFVLAASSLFATSIPNWAAPATWTPAKAAGGLSTQDITNPLPFIGLPPCRIVDTRGGAPITGGIFPGGADGRPYDVTGICGIAATAHVLSLNFTITGPGQTTPGFLTAWPAGGAVPPVSILNWDHV